MRGAVFARDQDYDLDYIDALYGGMWEQAMKLDDDDVIRATLSAAGLPIEEIMTGMVDPTVKQRLIENTENSVGRGTFGSPTLFVGDEIFFGKDKLRDALEAAQG
jgi:2-hydroxychromene-2-carboxylate isomerase